MKIGKKKKKKNRQKMVVGAKKIGKKVWSVKQIGKNCWSAKNISHLAKIWSLFANFFLPIR